MGNSPSPQQRDPKQGVLGGETSLGSEPPLLEVYTAVNRQYESFIPVFIWSTLISNSR